MKRTTITISASIVAVGLVVAGVIFAGYLRVGAAEAAAVLPPVDREATISLRSETPESYVANTGGSAKHQIE